MALAVGIDFLRGDGTPDFGMKQAALALAGFAVVASGLELATAARTSRPLHWRAALAGIRVAEGVKLVGVVVQLALLLLVVRAFGLETAAFQDRIVPLAVYGFVLHHLLPVRFRLPFFALLSVAGIALVFGLVGGAWLVALGLSLIGICHLPIAFGARVAMLIAAGALLAAMRAEWARAPWPAAIWPILGSMFMFRLIVYMYDLRHSREPVSAARSLSYFFLLPNVAFPLFPVVDFATFRRTYYDREAFAIYQQGVQWMVRGIVHLLLYRLVYQRMTLAPADVRDTADLVQYLLATFLLYLRVSGQFHLIVGMLHLFGFRLPETHRFFYLASSFTDFWRRINIYWKDFMQKVVYLPVHFRVRRVGPTSGIVLPTVAVFAATWALHSYQWFWILGSLLLSWTDALFWLLLAVLLVPNALREVRRGRARSVGARALSLREGVPLALRTVATFVVICLLWSLWTSPSVTEWLALLSIASVTPTNVVAGAGLVAVAALALALFYRTAPGAASLSGATAAPTPFTRSLARSGAVLAALLVAGSPAVTSRLDAGTRELALDLRSGALSKGDAEMLQRGYYERLTNANPLNSQLWAVYATRPGTGARIIDTEAARLTGDFLYSELVASTAIDFLGRPFTTNRWGMRDRDYELRRPAGTRRIAVLGASYVMGQGVADDETFENLVEDRLDRERAPGAPLRYELLNFAGPFYSPPQQIAVLERKAFAFEPDVVLLVSHPTDMERAAGFLARMVASGVAVPDDELADIARGAGLTAGVPEDAARRIIAPYREAVLAAAYRRIVRMCRERGAIPVWVFLGTPEENPLPADAPRMRRIAKEAGFLTIDLSRVYHGHDLRALQVAQWDRHPNALGHRVIAEHFHQALREHPELLLAPRPAQPSPGDTTWRK